MGYWGGEDGGPIWGDQPADVMDDAIREIVDIFRSDWNRNPTTTEMLGGFMFSMLGCDDNEWAAHLEEFNPWVQVGQAKTVTTQPGLLNSIPSD